jgi:hypothetical protein
VSKPLTHLTQAGRIGTMQLKNRMVVTAMGASIGEINALLRPIYYKQSTSGNYSWGRQLL